MQSQKITINDKCLNFNPGQTILEVAEENNIWIPTLCYLKGATPTGSCRICVVEVEGRRTLSPACSTPAEPDMVIHTESPKVVASRRDILELLLASGNHNCPLGSGREKDWKAAQNDDSTELCPACGDCRLQDLAVYYQVTGEIYVRSKEPEPHPPMETVNPFIVRDFSRCILCGRCVQACNEIQVNNAISFGYRGAETKIVAAGDRPLRDSECVFCGECVQACPVGALVEKNARYDWRPWEVKKTRTTCSYCGVGCQLELHVKNNRVIKVTGAEGTPPNKGSMCVKGRFGFDFINSDERLTTPLIKEDGEFRKATWNEALNLTAQRLGEIRDEYGSDSLGVLTSARVSNEENYLAQKFARAVLKTNNVDHCARL